MESYFQVDHLDVDRLLSEWRWLCPQSLTLVARSAFGDLFLRDEAGKIFKLDIAIGQMNEVAKSETEFRDLAGTKEKREQWFAESDELAGIERGTKTKPRSVCSFQNSHHLRRGGHSEQCVRGKSVRAGIFSRRLESANL